MEENKGAKGFSITSMILGISSIILIFIQLEVGVICCILSIIFGIIGIHKGGKGMRHSRYCLRNNCSSFSYNNSDLGN
jgi:hypothetical protein